MNSKFASMGAEGTMPTVFGEWLKSERKKKGLTQEQLAELCDLTKAQISRVESGNQGTKRATAVRLAEALSADPREALRALMADTPGFENEPQELERTPTDEEWELIERYRGVTPGRRELLKRLWESAVEVIDKEPALEDIPEVR